MSDECSRLRKRASTYGQRKVEKAETSKSSYAADPEPKKAKARMAYQQDPDKKKEAMNRYYANRVRSESSAKIKSSVYRPDVIEDSVPAFAGMHVSSALDTIATCHGTLETTKWSTCVRCWRGWYAVEANTGFRYLSCFMSIMLRYIYAIELVTSINFWLLLMV